MAAPASPAVFVDGRVGRLRAIFEDVDVLGMVYAETYRARRDNLPHRSDAACLLTEEVVGCDGLCSAAVAGVIDDAVGFYRRQLVRGVVGELLNPGGYARTIIRQRHLDVVRALTTPDGGYRRPERIADPAKRPAYLGLADEVDGLLVSASMFFLRSGRTVTTWARVCEHAEATCIRKGFSLEPGEGRVRLDRFVAAALRKGGRAEAFVRREVLDLLAARSVTPVAAVADHTEVLAPGQDEQHEAALDRHLLKGLLGSIDAALVASGGWSGAAQADRVAAVQQALGTSRTSASLAEIVDLISELHAES